MASIKQLRSFITVADYKSFTQAAVSMFMTQPAVSSQIKSLEDTLGLSLIERNDKRVQLTEAGRLFYREAKEILAVYDRVVESMEEFKGLKKGCLALGASTIPGEYLMPRYIGEFRKLYPGINISLTIADTGQVVELLYERKVDLGVVGAKTKSKHVSYVPFLEDELILLAGTDCSIPDSISSQDLLNFDMIFREAGSGTRSVVRDCLAAKGIKESDLKVVMELGSTQSVITGVAGNLGLAFVSKWAAEAALKAGEVKKIHVDDLDLRRNIYVASLQNAAFTKARDTFFNFLTQK
ncbi:MAG: selenium metabolism-associated LysR family transcriptional regulator [Bacillota bacterium]|jgi:DNA-binding transcriptional LysR family regulator